MATPKQLREIFAPILAEHPDLVLRGRWLFRPPIESAIIGLYIGRTRSAHASNMALSVVPLSRFMSPDALGYGRTFEVERVIGVPAPNRRIPGEELLPPRIFQDMFEPDYQAHLLRNFNAKVPAFLDAVRSFDDVVAWVRSFLEPGWPGCDVDMTAAWHAAMRGDFATAADGMQAHFDRMGPPSPWSTGDERRQQEAVRDVLHTGDRATIAEFLHGMEAQTIAHHQLQRFWRRTPFPFEQS